MTLQKKATIFATTTAALLSVIKLIFGVMSGSVAIIASAVDSILDMLISIFNYFAISNSEKPADSEFNYGRGKIEALAGVIEGTVITISGLFIIYQSIDKVLEQKVTQHLDNSVVVMVVSFFITLALVIYLNYVAKKTNSLVIKSDALHYKTDLYSNGAVLVALVVVKFTGWELVDALMGAVIAVYIIYSAYEIIKEGILILLDRSIDKELVAKIRHIIQTQEGVEDYHFLKTREAGKQTFVDVHLVFNTEILLLTAHRISDTIEENIRLLDDKRDWVFNIHLDPYDDSIIHKEEADSKSKN